MYKHLARIGLALYLAAFAIGAHATFPNVLGTYTGTSSAVDSGCSNPADDGPSSDPLTLVISQQNGSLISGTVGDPDSQFPTSGSVDAAGTIVMSFSGPDAQGGGTTSGVFTGTLSGNTLPITFSGANVGGDGCTFSGSATLTRSGNSTVSAAAPGSTATTPATLLTTVTAFAGLTNARVQDALPGTRARPKKIANGFMLEGDTGRAAGDGLSAIGVWGSYSHSGFDNDFAATAIDGQRDSGMFGADFSPWEDTVLGIAIGYEDNRTDTRFNQGHVDSTGYTISPYFGAVLSETWSIDLSMGYSDIGTDQYRTDPATTARVNSSFDSTRWFWSGNLNGTRYFGNWVLGGTLGWLYARDDQDAYTESNGTAIGKRTVKLGQWHIGGNLAYGWGDFEPFTSLSYERDYSMELLQVFSGPQPANDRDDLLLGAGVRYYNSNGITGSFEWNKRLLRDQVGEDTYTLSVRVDF